MNHATLAITTLAAITTAATAQSFNLEWGSPQTIPNSTYAAYPDVDAGPTKAWMILNRQDAQWQSHWQLGFGRRPAEELYDLRRDPDYLHNLADDPMYESIRCELSARLMTTLKATGDPRVLGDGATFDRPPFVSR